MVVLMARRTRVAKISKIIRLEARKIAQYARSFHEPTIDPESAMMYDMM
jgi:hypothetical protein